jgi:hypothetical protein
MSSAGTEQSSFSGLKIISINKKKRKKKLIFDLRVKHKVLYVELYT